MKYMSLKMSLLMILKNNKLTGMVFTVPVIFLPFIQPIPQNFAEIG